MTPTNIWVENDFKNIFVSVFQKRRLDLIPAICEGKDGFCMLSMAPDEIHKILGTISRGVKVNSTGTMVARLMGTDVQVDVCSVHKLEV